MMRSSNLLSRPLVAGIAGGIAVALLGWLAIAAGWIQAEASSAPATTARAVEPAAPVSDEATSVAEVYERARGAIAFIEADQVSSEPSPFGPAPGEGTATGSGFLINDRGHLLTNAHVVDGSDSVRVKLGPEGKALDAKVLGSDTSTDVAVLEVDASQIDASPLRLADSEEVAVGDGAIAIGNPFGLDLTVTTGIISALQREISAPDGFTISDVIQTDAAINPGNSGGPLLDARGRVIGINSQIATAGGQGSVGVGFAVPVNTAQRVFDQILDDGDADHAFIGVSGADLTAELAGVLNLELERGALVQDVTPDSPADQAGLRAGEATMTQDGGEVRIGGDVIIGVDGDEVNGMDDVVAAVNRKAPGDEIALEIFRDGGTKELTLQLADRPSQPSS